VVCLATVWIILNVLTTGRPTEPDRRALGTINAPNNAPLQRFPTPNLQIIPHDDLVALRSREEDELNTYAWIDRRAGVVRIPIERAMDLVAAHGLPVTPTNAPPTAGKSSLELIRERSEKR
jgi:hypothetical protein